MEFTTKLVSYEEVKNGYRPLHDDFGLFAGLTDARKQVFFANPNQNDDTKCLLNLELVDGVVAGRTMSYDVVFRADNKTYTAASGSALDVAECYRQYGVGATLMMNVIGLDYNYFIFAGISDQALPLYKKLRYHILEYPRMMQLRASRQFLEAKGFGRFSGILSKIVDIPLKIWLAGAKHSGSSLKKKYTIKQEYIVPDWVNSIALDEKYKYMEVHDQKWLQWNLDYNFTGKETDKQFFYSIYIEDKPYGFFMIKERFRENAGPLKNVYVGSIVEWGSLDENILDEVVINRIAMSHFSDQIDIVEFASANAEVAKRMERYGFVKHGYAHIVFKDKTKQFKDASDILNWRIRYGYSDVIFT